MRGNGGWLVTFLAAAQLMKMTMMLKGYLRYCTKVLMTE